MAIKRVAVVLNGKAGALLDQSQPGDDLQQALADAGLDADVIPDDAGTLPERLALAMQRNPDAILVAGGDGTVACAAHILSGSDLPLGILPFGTMNLLAKDVGLPIGDLHAAVQVVAAGRARAIDIGEVNGRVFLCASMLGMPAHLGRTREETRGSGLRLVSRMATAAARLLKRNHRLRLQLSLDGKMRRVKAASLTITMGPIDETCGRTFGRTDLESGQLGVYLIQRIGVQALARLAIRMLLGRWRSDDAVSERLAREVDIAGEGSLHVMNDGELALLDRPLRYRVRPGALQVLVP